jgi:hypothetical protein
MVPRLVTVLIIAFLMLGLAGRIGAQPYRAYQDTWGGLASGPGGRIFQTYDNPKSRTLYLPGGQILQTDDPPAAASPYGREWGLFQKGNNPWSSTFSTPVGRMRGR